MQNSVLIDDPRTVWPSKILMQVLFFYFFIDFFFISQTNLGLGCTSSLM